MVCATGIDSMKGHRTVARGICVVVFENAICIIAGNTDTGAVMLPICNPLRSSIIVVGSEDFLPARIIEVERERKRWHVATWRGGNTGDGENEVSVGTLYRVRA